ncbi:MAG: hypothetical protein HY360_07700 [Verrucomicrobia bacterium]|nr:hypothetical protein [Verrucomicrobiota bacterium]
MMNELLESLLWRGFLAVKQGERILLSRGSPREDLETMQECGLHLRRLRGRKWSAEVSLPPKTDAAALFESIRNLPAANHMTGPSDFGFMNRNENSFRRCKYGPRVPVECLDPGIALFVKTMPMCGIRTVMSCQGHPDSPNPKDAKGPIVWVFSYWDLHWAQEVFRLLATHPEFARLRFKFFGLDKTASKDWEAWRFEIRMPNGGGHDHRELFKRIQMAARVIMGNGEEIRTRKAGYHFPELKSVSSAGRGRTRARPVAAPELSLGEQRALVKGVKDLL